MESVGARVRRQRRRARLTQEELAERAEIDRRYLGKIETEDITEPGIDTLDRIATALGVHISELADPRWYAGLDVQAADWLAALRSDQRLDEDAKELIERVAFRLMRSGAAPPNDLGHDVRPQRAVGS